MFRRHWRFISGIVGGTIFAIALFVTMATNITERTEAQDNAFERNREERAAFFDGENALVPLPDHAMPTFFEESSDCEHLSFYWTNAATQETRRVTLRTSCLTFRFEEGASAPRALFTLRKQLDSGIRSFFDRHRWEDEILAVTVVGRQDDLLRRAKSLPVSID